MLAIHRTLAAAVLTIVQSGAGCLAQESQGSNVMIELNALEPVENACRITFLVQNGHDTEIDKAVYEAVLFDTQGRVDRLTLFDFGTMPPARPRVRQFVVPGLACTALGRLLINGAETCTGDGLPDDACTLNLDLRSRVETTEVMG